MRQLNARDLGTDLDLYLELVKVEPIVIAKAGKLLAVIMSIEEFQRFERLSEAAQENGLD